MSVLYNHYDHIAIEDARKILSFAFIIFYFFIHNTFLLIFTSVIRNLFHLHIRNLQAFQRIVNIH